MSKPRKLLVFFYALIPFLFFLQGVDVINVIPVKLVLNLLGLNSDLSSIVLAGLYAFIFVFVAAIIGEILYSIGFKRNAGIINQGRIFAHGAIAFLTIWVTFFSYSIMTTFGIVPNTQDLERFLNFYLCWYILFEVPFVLFFLNKKSKKKNIVGSKSNVFDLQRVTWWSHITNLNMADGFAGTKGEVVYKQGIISNIISLVIFIVIAMMTSPIFHLLGTALFFDINVDPPSFTVFVKIMSGFFFFGLLITFFVILGEVFSKRMVLYKNCINLPLVTLSNKPIFTLLLPKSAVLLGFKDIVSYNIKKKRREKSDETYISTISFKMDNGDYYVFEPSVSLSFEKILTDAIEAEKDLPTNF